jgi:hypothetical protein
MSRHDKQIFAGKGDETEKYILMDQRDCKITLKRTIARVTPARKQNISLVSGRAATLLICFIRTDLGLFLKRQMHLNIVTWSRLLCYCLSSVPKGKSITS